MASSGVDPFRLKVQGSTRTPKVGQELHGDLALDVGQGGVELVQLEDHPCRGEVHGRRRRSFRCDGYRKSVLRTC